MTKYTELERLIKACREVLTSHDQLKQSGFAKSFAETHRNKMYDLRKATERAEDEINKKQTELFS